MKSKDTNSFLFDYADFNDQNFYDCWHLVNNWLNQNKQNKVEITLVLTDKNLPNLQFFFNLILGLRKLYCQNSQRVIIILLNNITSYLTADLDSIELVWSFMVKNLILEQNNYTGFYSNEINFVEDLINNIEKSN